VAEEIGEDREYINLQYSVRDFVRYSNRSVADVLCFSVNSIAIGV
jgi:hypothetical protein